MQDKITVIIPAGGLGRRMKSYGPKSLIDLGGELLVIRQLKMIKKVLPNADIILVLGFDADKIKKFIPAYVKIIENKLYEETNVAYSISLGINISKQNRVMIIYGDLVFNEKILNYALDSSSVIIDSNNQMRDQEVGVNVFNGLAYQFSYSLPIKWAQIAYLKGKELELFKEVMLNPLTRKYYGFEIFNKIIDKGGLIKTIEPDGMRIAEIDSSKDIDIARKIVEEKE